MKGGKDKSMEGIRMYKEKQKVGFGMNYTQSRELKENNRIYREMESIYHEICVKAGISDTDFIVLYSIVEFEDGCCQRKIAKQYSISRQTVNSSVKKLVQNGCVVLESGKGHDKQIVLTEKGKAMAKQKIIPVMEAEAGVFMHMTEEERKKLLRLNAIYGNFQTKGRRIKIMNIQLSDHFTYRRLIRFTISTVLMLICTSMYSIVDGLFVSNYVGKMPFAATNLIWPVSMGIAAIGFMLGTGGSAIVAKTLGEGKKEKANQYFSMILYFGIIVSVIFSVICFIFTPQIARMLKADGELLEHCIVYGRILFATQTAFILQNMFQSFLVAAEEPVLSLKINIAAGLTNVVFDYLFIAVFEWGVAGAAIATGMGQIVGGIAPFFFFAKGSRNGLRITWRTKLYKDILLKTCMNGSSEMVTNLSTSLVNILYNFQLMKLAGADGVAAFGVIMYVNFIFVAVFMGYSVGSAPIVSYHYGAGNDAELHNLYRKSKNILIVAGIVLTIAAEILSMPLVRIFVNYDKELLLMTVRGFRLFSFSFLIMGINIWASSFFTALNNGFVSAAISFLRTFLFQVAAVCFLPLIIGIDGVWTSVLAAETMALAVTIIFLIKEKKKYRY